MRTSPPSGALALAALLTIGAAGPGAAAAPSGAPVIAAAADSAADAATRLGRAAREWRTGDLRAVIESLEPLGFGTPSFAEADRAAFLLGQAYLRLGERARFDALARRVSAWRQPSDYTTWMEFELAWRGGEAADSASLAAVDTTTALGRDLAGVVLVGAAARAIERGDDPAPWLDAVPPGSRFHSTARHMRGRHAIERGDPARAAEILTTLVRGDTTYPGRREAWLALAGLALDRGDWTAARAGYEALDADWRTARDRVAGLLGRKDLESLWRAWEQAASAGDAWRLDTGEALAAARDLADRSADLRSRPAAGPPGLSAWRPGHAVPPAPAPEADALRMVQASADALAEESARLTRARWDLVREREALESRRRYLDYGGGRARAIESDLAARAATLDSLRSDVEALVAELRRVRDESTRRMVRRANEVMASCERTLAWIRAMRHFHLDGPERGRSRPMPPGIPSRDVLLAEEEALARAIEALAAQLAAEAPARIARSHDESWGPSLVNRIFGLSAEAGSSLAFARALGASVDSSRALAVSSDTLRAREARVALAERARLRRHAEHVALRDRVARHSLRAALAALDVEREAIEYGLAVSAYALAVNLAPDGGAGADAAIPFRPSSAVTSPPDSVADAAGARWRDRAIAAHRSFLERRAGSFARGEMRFRLADLLLVDARHRFQEQMAAYLKAQSEGRAAGLRLPVLSHAPALALYRALLAEDHDFPHRDAALFNAGMILADGGDPEAAAFFDTLVTRHPESRYAQESHLRMGDLDFDARRFRAAVERYRRAAAGADPNLRVIALYKTGWAHFNEDRFTAAADAFRAVLDQYAAPGRGAIEADVEKEAETYLVHSLAGAGGANAVLDYFERAGTRTWERRVLIALAQHFRRYGRLKEAAATDALALERYPEHPEALQVAGRLIETRLRAGDAAGARAARLDHAVRFAPRGSWHRAQSSDSLRAAGAAFARDAWEKVAAEHHRAARARGAGEDWRQALAVYGRLLEHWNDGEDGARLRLLAGEAATALADWPEALEHYRLAAGSGSDSTAAAALWQRVAVTDRWYATTRAGTGRAATGSDSLAREVRRSAEALLARFPSHPEAAALTWRRGQLAYAHGWHEEAARDFERLVERHPSDRRAPDAAALRAEALDRQADYGGALAAWEQTLALARAAGRDSLARRAAAAIPVCAYREAEHAVTKDPGDHVGHARRFENVAARWPAYEHAHAAQYRAGLAYFRAGRAAEGAAALGALTTRFPGSPYVRDAHLEIARGWEQAREPARAAEAFEAFAAGHPADSSAKDAWLRAGDLFEAAGMAARAETLRLDYVRRHPGDHEAALEILEPLARRDLAGVSAARPISTLLPAKPAPAKAKARPAPAPGGSHLASYLRLAAARPELASRGILAHVAFLEGEEADARGAAIRLTLPLARSLAARRKLLEQAIAAWKRSVEIGVPEWAHAAAFRMGEALVAFGQAVERSERPADLQGDDRLAYEDVLAEQGAVFAGRGEQVWTDLLRQKGIERDDDPWLARARTALWQRLGNRFFYRPEVEHPLVKATPAERIKVEKDPKHGKDGGTASRLEENPGR